MPRRFRFSIQVIRVAFALCSVCVDAAEYEIVWMPEGLDPGRVVCNLINAGGQVAASQVDLKPSPQSVRWSSNDRRVEPLGMLPGRERRTSSRAINERGWIVGNAYEGDNHLAYPYIWMAEGGMQPLPTLGGTQTVPVDINGRGQVVGWAINSYKGSHAFLWTPEEGIFDLGTLVSLTEDQSTLLPSPPMGMQQVTQEVSSSGASAINELGWIAGSASADDRLNHPVIWHPESGITDLGLLPGYDWGGQACGVNDSGVVLVNFLRMRWVSATRAVALGRPYIWTVEGGYSKLPVPEGYEDIRGIEINNRGEVLLHARHDPAELGEPVFGRSFLLSSGHLEELPEIQEADATAYLSINDRGWLVGRAITYPDGVQGDSMNEMARGFVAIPISTEK